MRNILTRRLNNNSWHLHKGFFRLLTLSTITLLLTGLAACDTSNGTPESFRDFPANQEFVIELNPVQLDKFKGSLRLDLSLSGTSSAILAIEAIGNYSKEEKRAGTGEDIHYIGSHTIPDALLARLEKSIFKESDEQCPNDAKVTVRSGQLFLNPKEQKVKLFKGTCVSNSQLKTSVHSDILKLVDLDNVIVSTGTFKHKLIEYKKNMTANLETNVIHEQLTTDNIINATTHISNHAPDVCFDLHQNSKNNSAENATSQMVLFTETTFPESSQCHELNLFLGPEDNILNASAIVEKNNRVVSIRIK